MNMHSKSRCSYARRLTMLVSERTSGDRKELRRRISSEKNAKQRDRLRAVAVALEGQEAPRIAAVFAGTQCRGKAVGIPQATLLEQPHLPRLPGAIHPDDGGLESPSPGSSSLFVFHRLGRAHDLKEKHII